jgi:hypothetical protein
VVVQSFPHTLCVCVCVCKTATKNKYCSSYSFEFHAFDNMSEESILLRRYKGTLAIFGAAIDRCGRMATETALSRGVINSAALQNRVIRDGGESYHMTLLTADEADKVREMATHEADIAEALKRCDLLDAGVGKCTSDGNSAVYAVIVSPDLQKLRRKLMGSGVVSYAYLHITLGFSNSDIHDKRKDLSTIVAPNEHDELPRKVEYALRSFSSWKRSSAEEITELERLSALMQQRKYLFGAYYFAKWVLRSGNSARASHDVLEQFIENSDGNCKCLLPEDDGPNYGQLTCDALNYNLFAVETRYHRLSRYYKCVPKDAEQNGKRHHIYNISFSELPRNFSFVAPNLAGSSIVDRRLYFETFAHMGITDVITVMERPLREQLYEGLPIAYHFFEVADQEPPTLRQMIEIVGLCCRPGAKVLVHCMGGVGRTATVLCSVLMHCKRPMSRLDAKAALGNRKTILSPTQEEFLAAWFGHCSDETVVEDNLQQPSAPLVKLPNLIVCVGYPASGKSTFAKLLSDSFPNSVSRINQDEQGRRCCENQIGSMCKVRGKTVLLDRCNLTQQDRAEWLELAHRPEAWVVFFDVPSDECRWRIVRRQGHPTIKVGSGQRIIDSVADTLEVPALSEGFEKMFVVRTFEESNALLASFGCASTPVSTLLMDEGDDQPVKFPRTRHVANLGAATRDDLVMTPAEVQHTFLNRELFIEEKVDGANLGFCIRNHQLRAQNRSHYVTSAYHPQFKHLDKWMHKHADELWQILDASDRYILYGEWLYARHSIKYSKLKDWFIVFDMFDRLTGKFWSRTRLENHLKQFSFSLVPLLFRGSMASVDQLRDLVQTKSVFYDGIVEGVYVRTCDELWLVERGKIVRSDFISGNEFWSKGGVEPNTLLKPDSSSSRGKADSFEETDEHATTL